MGDREQQPRVFSLEEANGLVPRLTTELSRLAKLREAVADVARALGGPDDAVEILEERRVATPAEAAQAERLRSMADEIAAVVSRIHDLGGLVKDLELGLVDFYGEVDGETVFWCWQYGEAEIGYWHTLDEGFANRRPVDPDGRREEARLLN
jgi:hypothetical protein